MVWCYQHFSFAQVFLVLRVCANLFQTFAQVLLHLLHWAGPPMEVDQAYYYYHLSARFRHSVLGLGYQARTKVWSQSFEAQCNQNQAHVPTRSCLR